MLLGRQHVDLLMLQDFDVTEMTTLLVGEFAYLGCLQLEFAYGRGTVDVDAAYLVVVGLC